MRDMFRLPPVGPVSAYKTYSLRAPRATHWRPARCEEVDDLCSNSTRATAPCFERHCGPHAHGWKVTVPPLSPAAKWIETRSKRAYVDTSNVDGTVTYTFPAGQQCFEPHYLPIGREPLYVIRDGDFRGNPTGRRVQIGSAQSWIDDFGEHQERIHDRIERG